MKHSELIELIAHEIRHALSAGLKELTAQGLADKLGVMPAQIGRVQADILRRFPGVDLTYEKPQQIPAKFVIGADGSKGGSQGV